MNFNTSQLHCNIADEMFHLQDEKSSKMQREIVDNLVEMKEDNRRTNERFLDLFAQVSILK